MCCEVIKSLCLERLLMRRLPGAAGPLVYSALLLAEGVSVKIVRHTVHEFAFSRGRE